MRLGYAGEGRGNQNQFRRPEILKLIIGSVINRLREIRKILTVRLVIGIKRGNKKELQCKFL